MAIDLEDFKAHIGLTSSDQNDAAQGILDAANAAIANRVGPLSPRLRPTRWRAHPPQWCSHTLASWPSLARLAAR